MKINIRRAGKEDIPFLGWVMFTATTEGSGVLAEAALGVAATDLAYSEHRLARRTNPAFEDLFGTPGAKLLARDL